MQLGNIGSRPIQTDFKQSQIETTKPQSGGIQEQSLKSVGIETLSVKFEIGKSGISIPPKNEHIMLDTLDHLMEEMDNFHSDGMNRLDVIEQKMTHFSEEKQHIDDDFEAPHLFEDIHDEMKANVEFSKLEFQLEKQGAKFGEGLIEDNSHPIANENTKSRELLEFSGTLKELTTDTQEKIQPKSIAINEISIAKTNVQKDLASPGEHSKVAKEKVGLFKKFINAAKSAFSSFVDTVKSFFKEKFASNDRPVFVSKFPEWKNPETWEKKGAAFKATPSMSDERRVKILDKRDDAIASTITLAGSLGTLSTHSSTMIGESPAAVSRRLGHGLAEIEEGISKGTGDKETLMNAMAKGFAENASALTLDKFPIERLTDFKEQLQSEGRTDKAMLLGKLIDAIVVQRDPETVHENNIDLAKDALLTPTDEGTFLRGTSDPGAIALKNIMNSYTREMRQNGLDEILKLKDNEDIQNLQNNLKDAKITARGHNFTPELAEATVGSSIELLKALTKTPLPEDAKQFLQDMTNEINSRTDIDAELKKKFVYTLYADQVFLKLLSPVVTNAVAGNGAPSSLTMLSAIFQKFANNADDGKNNQILAEKMNDKSKDFTDLINNFLVQCGMPSTVIPT